MENNITKFLSILEDAALGQIENFHKNTLSTRKTAHTDAGEEDVEAMKISHHERKKYI